jgi:hypothetical protein
VDVVPDESKRLARVRARVRDGVRVRVRVRASGSVE